MDDNKKNDKANELLQLMMKKSYVNGLSDGILIMCESFLKKMQEVSKINPAKQIQLLRLHCMNNIKNIKTAEDKDKNNILDSEND